MQRFFAFFMALDLSTSGFSIKLYSYDIITVPSALLPPVADISFFTVVEHAVKKNMLVNNAIFFIIVSSKDQFNLKTLYHTDCM